MLQNFMIPTVYQQDNYERRHFLTLRNFKLSPGRRIGLQKREE
jgi:hypothetical protein